jgi:hypothetical protein
MAIAQSSMKTQLLPRASMSNSSLPSRNDPVRSPGAKSADGDKKVFGTVSHLLFRDRER